MSEEKFVCNINVAGRYGSLIMAGTPFQKEQLVLHTFESLTAQKHITNCDPVIPVAVISKPKGVALTSISPTVPDAALHPPTVSVKDQMKRAKADAIARVKGREAKALKIAAEAAGKAQKASEKVIEEANAATVLSEDEEIQKLIDAEDTTPEKKTSTVENIWIANPEDIKDFAFERLFSVYRTICEDNNIEPKKFGEDDKGLLIDELSSQFQK